MSITQHQITFEMNVLRVVGAIVILGTLLALNGVYLYMSFEKKMEPAPYDPLLFALQLCGMFCLFPALCLSLPDAEAEDDSKKA